MTDHDDNEITLKQAAKIAGVKKQHLNDAMPESERPANQSGAEATAVLDTMLAASRKGKVVRGGQ